MHLPVSQKLPLLALCTSFAVAGCGDDATSGTVEESDIDGGYTDYGDAENRVLDSGARRPSDANFPDATKRPALAVDAAPPADPAYCRAAGNEVAILGDSYIQLSGDFTRLLQERAREGGALGATDTYVDHALSGASMNGFPNIPSQLPDAIADSKGRGSNGIRIVIMDGGGNDVLVNNRHCLDPKSVAEVAQSATCVKVVDDALGAAQQLFDTGVEQGLQAAVYFFYPHLPKSSLGAGPNANNILDYAVARAKVFCEKQTKARCIFVDLRPAFDDPSDPGWPREGLIAFDGIHPTLKGSQLMADEVWKAMQASCVAAK